MAEVKITKGSELQSNLKLGQNKDFLKLNMQKLKQLSKVNENRKRDLSPKAKKPLQIKTARKNETATLIGDGKRDPVAKQVLATERSRLKGGAMTRTPIPSKPETSKMVKIPQKKDQNYTVLLVENTKKDQSVQSCDTEAESFFKNAKIVEPSAHIIEAILASRQKATKVEKPKPQTRKFEKHSSKLETHLDNLKEFMERGSISRRRKNIEKRREEIQRKLGRYGIITDSHSIPTTIYHKVPQEVKFSPSTKLKHPAVNKITKLPMEKEIGDSSLNEDSKRLVVVYQRD